MTSQRVVVVGAGIIGLTSAVRLSEAGYDVAVLARDLPLETTSAVAAALWYPYRADPPTRLLAWAEQSFGVFLTDAADPESGVKLVDGLELRATSSEPWFASAMPAEAGFAHFADGPAGYQDGWQMRLPIIEPACYLPALVRRLESMGGTMTRMVVSALPDDALVVNCTGLASRALAHDESLTPVRGQVVHLSRVPNVDAWLLDQTDPTNPVYVVPRSEDIVVGGTAEANNFDSHPNDVDVGAIVARASRLIPALADAKVLSTAAALRPTRPQVRVEVERRASGGYVVHNYGHGGAGWTIAWGCADEVVGLLQQVGADATGLPV